MTIKRLFPIIIILLLILFLTFQSPASTIQVSDGFMRLFKYFLPEVSGRWINDKHYFRSLMHIPLYFILGLAVGFSIPHVIKAVSICSLIALTDEILKIFLPTREFQATDLGFDAIGFLTGIGIVFMFRLLKRKRIQKTNKKC